MESKMYLVIVLLFTITVQVGNCFQSKSIPDSVKIQQIFRGIQTSLDEKWISYQVKYGEAADTLFLYSLETSQNWSFSENAQLLFDASSNWALINSPGQSGQLINLFTGRMYSMPNSAKAVFWQETNALILWQETEAKLIWHDLETHKETVIEGITQFWEGPSPGLLVVEWEGGLFQINKKEVTTWKLLIAKSKSKYSYPTWAGGGMGLVFYKMEPGDTILYHLNLRTHVLNHLDIVSFGLPYQLHTPRNIGRSTQILEDDGWVLVPVKDTIAIEEDPIVERWQSDTSSLFPKEKTRKEKPLYAAWNPEGNRLSLLSKNHADRFIPIRNTHKLLVYDESLYNADYVNYPKTDFRLIDLDQNKEKILLDSMVVGYEFMCISPRSKYITYFRDRNWWLYDIGNGQHINLTKEIPTTWADVSRYGKDIVPYDQPTWLEKDNAILLQDEYDLWLVNIGEMSFKRITHGKEKEITYQVDHYALSGKNPFRRYHSKEFSLEDGILFKTKDTEQDRGYAIFNQKGLKQILSMQAVYYDRMSKTDKGYFWVQEAFGSPPALWYQKGNKRPVLIKALNTDIPKESFGSNQLMTYSNSDGDTLNGILYYPPDFDSSQQYPMVVHIYEEQSSLLNRFLMPGYRHNYIGFNIVNLLKRGYLVFLPDIKYRLGFPGPSALDNVESGVKEIITRGIVKIGSIGLYGHSFGAYEAAYILTRSNLFTTGVLGSGVYDIVVQYLTYNDAYGQRPDLWRYETQQYRMGSNLFADFQNYLDNSPIYHLSSLDVPILIWTGKEDPNVTWHQSLKLHIALRRMGKFHEFLVFPNQDHVLLESNTREVLTKEIEAWWDKYL